MMHQHGLGRGLTSDYGQSSNYQLAYKGYNLPRRGASGVNIKKNISRSSTFCFNQHSLLILRVLRALRSCQTSQTLSNLAPVKGFTLIEVLITVVIVGIMGAIVAPSWLGFLRQQELNASQNQIFTAMRRAQSLAKREQVEHQITFRITNNEQVQYAVHNSLALPSPPTAANLNSLPWENLSPSVYIPNSSTGSKDDSGIGYITFQSAGSGVTKIWRMQFDAKGNISDRLGRVILQHKADPTVAMARQQNKRSMRCVFVSTALGTIRAAADQDCNR